MMNIIARLFGGGKHERDLKEVTPILEEINDEYVKLQTLSDDELREKTQGFRQRIADETREIEEEIARIQQELHEDREGLDRDALHDRMKDLREELKETIEDVLDEILPEVFAVVKDTCRRLVGHEYLVVDNKATWDMIPFDVQLIGGYAMHKGKIAEMATGEGKTLVATLPIFLNALPGKGVHLVTVNDYLARRDSEWMSPIYQFHGLTVGCIQNDMGPQQRRDIYNRDITYGTNNEFGFDYLRDNMVIDASEMVQREHNFAIVDEVDSVLIDEARTPLIISGPVGDTDHKFDEMKPRVERLVNAQNAFIAKILAEAERLMKEGKREEAGVLIYRAQRGLPKNKRLLKILSEPENETLMLKTENVYRADNARRMPEIIDELYFSLDEKTYVVDLTDKGREFLAPSKDEADFFVLPDIAAELSALEGQGLDPKELQKEKDRLQQAYAERSDRIHTVHQLLKAWCLYEKDVEYVVQDGKIMIVDTFTGRILPGRRYSEGLHQAIEAKENVKVEGDTQTLATITLQNYFRQYKKLAGMTGTAETEAGEFFEIYKLDVTVIPTNKPIVRDDQEDHVYRTKREKYNAVIDFIDECRNNRQPTLVGTTSVEVSETLSRMLKRRGVPHNVLNAKQHRREAEIVANAGLPGAVTIATNMAGRGTDIKLGPGVKDAGGLVIIGTERHEARRIDRQLRGRAGRQGDPGISRFYLSLEDDLMRLFKSDRIAAVMTRLGVQEGEVIKHAMITKSVERAQKKVEENNFGIRKRLLEYDNVMNQQRTVIYSRRKQALLGENLKDEILEMVDQYAEDVSAQYWDAGDLDGLREELRRNLVIDLDLDRERLSVSGAADLKEQIVKSAAEFLRRKEEDLGHDLMLSLMRMALLQVIDLRWKEHLREMDDLKEGIHMRAYGQKDPLIEYKREAFDMFVQMLGMINREVLGMVFRLYPVREQMPQRPRGPRIADLVTSHQSSEGMGFHGNQEAIPGAEAPAEATAGKRQPIRVEKQPGRNDPCPCGSGKKYKHCHGE
ncbi:MAG: preprotein translocase subunit SecA [Bacteroidota bacterium]|jgi:preprotein translocase subunit SecA|nr:preprotein translocase subunit SecA [Bacteroidota bacterium]